MYSKAQQTAVSLLIALVIALSLILSQWVLFEDGSIMLDVFKYRLSGCLFPSWGCSPQLSYNYDGILWFNDLGSYDLWQELKQIHEYSVLIVL